MSNASAGGHLHVALPLRPQRLTVQQVQVGPNNATLSLGDALILSVGERLDCPVITRDTYWKWMVTNGLIAINVHVP